LQKVRSGYLDNWKPISDGHKRSLAQTLGPLDPQFDAAGLRLGPEVYIELMRTSRQSPISQTLPDCGSIIPSDGTDQIAFPTLVLLAFDLSAGLFNLGPEKSN
jgi:hypothetical protein